MKIVQPSATLEWITPNPLEVIERAGRTCYKSEPKGDPQAFVQMILRKGHESVLEHVTASFRIVCDRGISHEIVRHRLASYSQESTRFCNYSKNRFGGELTFIEPPGLSTENNEVFTSPKPLSRMGLLWLRFKWWRTKMATRWLGGDVAYVNVMAEQSLKAATDPLPKSVRILPSSKEIWVTHMEACEETYMALIRAGVSPQIARSVLPTCLKTELVMTANLREWRHFIKLREAPNAHPQIQPLARAIRLELEKHVGDVANPHTKD